MAKVSIECPGCFAKLNLPDRSKLGKKIKCPKCAEVFVAEAPDDDDDTEMLDEDDMPAKSFGGRKRPSAGSKKPSKKSGGSGGGNNAALIGGGVAALALLVVAGLYFGGVFGGKQPLPAPAVVAEAAPVAPPVVEAPKIEISPAEKMLALRWMPADTELLIHAKVADIWQAPLLKSALDTPEVAAVIARFQQNTGLAPTEIESITLGVADLTGALLRSKSASGPQLPPPESGPPGFGPSGLVANPLAAIRPEDQRFVVIVRTKKSVDFEAIAKTAPNGQMKDKNGRKYVEVPSQPSQMASGGWSPDSNTLIFGTLTDLLATIDRGETVIPRKEFAGVDHTSHLVLASVVKETKPEDMPAGIEMPAAITLMQESLKQYSMQGVSLGLSIKGGFDLNVAVLSGSTDGSQKLKTDIEMQLTGLKSQFGVIKATAPPLLGDLGQMLIDNLKINEQSQMVRVSTSVPDSAQQQLEQLPPLLMVMAMTGGLNPLASGPDKKSPTSLGVGPTDNSPGGLTEMKLPGETAAVPAVKFEGLSDNFKLTAKTGWDGIYMEVNKKEVMPLRLMLDVTGEGLKSVLASGDGTIKRISIDGGEALKLLETDNGISGAENLKKMSQFAVSDAPSFFHPANTMRLDILLNPPAGTAKQLSVVEGTFKYLTAEKIDEFTITEAPKKALRPLSDPQLKTAGVKLLLSKEPFAGNNISTLKLSWNEGFYIGSATITYPSNASSGGFRLVNENGKTSLKAYGFEDAISFTGNEEVKFTLYRNVKEHMVSFQFENVPLPSPESKPKNATENN